MQFCNVPNGVISNTNLIANATRIAPPIGIIAKNGFAILSGTESGIFIVNFLCSKYANTLIEINVIINAGNTPEAPKTFVGIILLTVAFLITSPSTITSVTVENGVTNKKEANAHIIPYIGSIFLFFE